MVFAKLIVGILLMLSLAGCSGGQDSTKLTRSGPVPEGTLILEEGWTYNREGKYNLLIITGRISNISDRYVDSAQAEFSLLDWQGTKIGTTHAISSQRIEAGASWQFSVPVSDDNVETVVFENLLGCCGNFDKEAEQNDWPIYGISVAIGCVFLASLMFTVRTVRNVERV